MRDLILLGTGQFRVAYLPLDLCGLSIFLELAAVYWKNVWLRECVYCLSLPGACLALIFSQLEQAPDAELFLHSWICPFMVYWFSFPFCCVLMVRSDHRSIVCHSALSALRLHVFRLRFLINISELIFFFLSSPSKGSPLVWFEQIFGNHLIGFPILMGIIWTGMYGSVAIIRFRKKNEIYCKTNTSANHNM